MTDKKSDNKKRTKPQTQSENKGYSGVSRKRSNTGNVKK